MQQVIKIIESGNRIHAAIILPTLPHGTRRNAMRLDKLITKNFLRSGNMTWWDPLSSFAGVGTEQ